MSDKFDSTSWTGDTSYRAESFTPKARAEVVQFFRWIAGAIAIGALVVVIAKGVM